MTILPHRNLYEWFIGDPLGSLITTFLVIAALFFAIKFFLDWSIMRMQINLAQTCIGGTC